MRLFDDRARAAEAGFARDEELGFLVRRGGLQALAAWAAECMALDAAGARAYEIKVVDLLIANVSDERLLETVQTDLERAGKPTLSMEVGPVFSRALAEANVALRGIVQPQADPNVDALDTWARRHPSTNASWGTFRF